MTRFFVLSQQEVQSTGTALTVLGTLPWAAPLLRAIVQGGGLVQSNMTLLFEARLALALHDAGITPQYEHATGVRDTSVDFQFDRWFVELHSLGETEGAKLATTETPLVSTRILKSPQQPDRYEAPPIEVDRQVADDIRRTLPSAEVVAFLDKVDKAHPATVPASVDDINKQSFEKEILKVIERVVGKAANNNGAPSKFPQPDGNHYSMLIMDTRAFGPMTQVDCLQVAYGNRAVAAEDHLFWPTGNDTLSPLSGAFFTQISRGHAHFRERVHFLGLVSEETYDRNELRYFIRFFGNPHIFQSEDEAREVLKTFPLYDPDMRRQCRPDLFLHEYRRPIFNEFQFAVLHDNKTVPCVVHLDTLQQLDERSTSSDEMAGSFEKHANILEALSIEMLNRGMTKSNGTVFIEPKHLELLPKRS